MACLVPCILSLLSIFQLGSSSATALDMTDNDRQLNCSEGLYDCSMNDCVLPDVEGPVTVSRLDLKVLLCCTADRKHCKPCLQILLFITVKEQHGDQDMSGDLSEEHEGSRHKEVEEEGSGGEMLISPTKASVRVCYSHPHFNRCLKVRFTLSPSAPEDLHPHEMWLSLLTDGPIMFGSPVTVSVKSNTGTTHSDITVPSLQDACSPDLDDIVKECDAPRLSAQIDQRKGVVLLQLDGSNVTQTNEIGMCQMFGPEDCMYQEWQRDQRQMIIPLNSITPCLCFRVWWKGKDRRREICPFMNQQELFRRMLDNVSVSVVEAQTSDQNRTALRWNVTAPCMLEGELWLCRKASAGGGRCEEVEGSRQMLHNHTHAGWNTNLHGHWKRGEFINVSPHPALCVQMKVQGIQSDRGPHCPFETPRGRWSLYLLIGVLFVCLATLSAYVIQGAPKGFLWRWLKEDDIKGAVGGGHVVLLYPPEADQALPGLVCRLGSSLYSLGFSVSLDLWSQAELSILGPVPWLHSRLDRLQRQGGKVVLVLTQAAWERAEEWGSLGWERDTSRGKNGEVGIGDRETERGCRAVSPYTDVFSASLSCILADYLQGRAGERFVLVQFESQPPQPLGSGRPLPELFRGLPLFSLPSQSLSFLTELAVGGRGGGGASARRRRAGGLRAASRALAGGLRGFTEGSSVFRLAGLSRDCVGTGVEDPWETVPLQPCLTTPPSSPDNCPKTSGMDWV